MDRHAVDGRGSVGHGRFRMTLGALVWEDDVVFLHLCSVAASSRRTRRTEPHIRNRAWFIVSRDLSIPTHRQPTLHT